MLALGIISVLIGVLLAVSLVSSDMHPGQVVFRALIMVVFGALVTLAPE